jgi:hypothetical protein
MVVHRPLLRLSKKRDPPSTIPASGEHDDPAQRSPNRSDSTSSTQGVSVFFRSRIHGSQHLFNVQQGYGFGARAVRKFQSVSLRSMRFHALKQHRSSGEQLSQAFFIRRGISGEELGMSCPQSICASGSFMPIHKPILRQVVTIDPTPAAGGGR